MKIIKKIFYYINQKKDKYKKKLEIIKYIKHSKKFDKKWYLNTYPDAKESILPPYLHYYEIGWKKGYHPSVAFDYKQYFEHNPDIKESGLNPLFHYEKYGKKEGRRSFYIDPQEDGNYKEYKYIRFLKRKLAKIIYRNKIKKNKNVKILVYCHIFYKKSIIEIKEYLKNLESYQYDLIVTCTKGVFEEEIQSKIRLIKPEALFYTYDNKGFDIGPFIDTLSKIDLKKYDIVFKLQSKGTFHRTSYIYGQLFRNRDWFCYLYEGILGAFTVHKTIDLLYSKDNNIGIIAAKNLIIQDNKPKINFTIKKLNELNLKIRNDYQFVAGTCYAQRAFLLEDLKKLKLTINDFEISKHGYYSRAHALERYMTSYITDKNYILYGNNICKLKRLKWKRIEQKLHDISGIRLIYDNRFEITDDFYLRTAESSLITKYEICKIKLKNITRLDKGIYTSLKEWAPYKFFLGEEKEYKEYCLKYRKTDYMGLSDEEFEKYVKKNAIDDYKKLIKFLDQHPYDNKRLIIIDANNNCILDGLHRASYYLYKYGEDYEIKVLKITYWEKNNIQNINSLFTSIPKRDDK